MQLLDTIEDFCEADPLVFLVMAAIIIAVLLGTLLFLMLRPLDKIRIEDQSPFGDALDRRSR